MAHRGDERTQHRLLLGQQIAQMQNVLAQTKAAHRNLSVSRKRAAQPLHEHLQFHTWRQAAVIAVLTEDISIAIDFISQYVYSHKRFIIDSLEIDPVKIRDKLESIIDRHNEEVGAGADNIDSELHFEASKFVAERLLYQWLVSTNVKGVAPTTSLLVEHFVVFWPAGSRGARFESFVGDLVRKPRCQEAWARRFRDVWNIKYQKMPQQPPLTDATITEKVIYELIV